MNVSSVTPSTTTASLASVSNLSDVTNRGRHSLDQFLKDALDAGKINQDQYDSVIQKLSDLNSKINDELSNAPDLVVNTKSIQDQVNSILKEVGLSLKNQGHHHHHRHSTSGAEGSEAPQFDILSMRVGRAHFEKSESKHKCSCGCGCNASSDDHSSKISLLA